MVVRVVWGVTTTVNYGCWIVNGKLDVSWLTYMDVLSTVDIDRGSWMGPYKSLHT